jgi:hypothetical protein
MDDALMPERVRVIAVVDCRRGLVHGMTCDEAVAQQWARDLMDKYGGDRLAASMNVALVAPPATPAEAGLARMSDAEEVELLAGQRDAVLALCEGVDVVPVAALYDACLHVPGDADPAGPEGR